MMEYSDIDYDKYREKIKNIFPPRLLKHEVLKLNFDEFRAWLEKIFPELSGKIYDTEKFRELVGKYYNPTGELIKPFPYKFGLNKYGKPNKEFRDFLASERFDGSVGVFDVWSYNEPVYANKIDNFFREMLPSLDIYCRGSVVAYQLTKKQFKCTSETYPYMKKFPVATEVPFMMDIRTDEEYVTKFESEVSEKGFKRDKKQFLNSIESCKSKNSDVMLIIFSLTFLVGGHAVGILVDLKSQPYTAYIMDSSAFSQNSLYRLGDSGIPDKTNKNPDLFDASVKLILDEYLGKTNVISIKKEKCPKLNIQEQWGFCQTWSFYLLILFLENEIPRKIIFQKLSQQGINSRTRDLLTFLYYSYYFSPEFKKAVDKNIFKKSYQKDKKVINPRPLLDLWKF